MPPYRRHSSRQRRYSLELTFSSQYVSHFFLRDYCVLYPFQAAVGVGESYDALNNLFERVASFLARFRVYTEKIPPSHTMSNAMVKVMTEVLDVLALATKHINQGRFSKWPITC